MGMVVRPEPSISPSLPAIVPPDDQTIEPWKSIVHWTEIRLEREAGKNRGYTKWIVPVTCGRHSSPDCRGKRDVMVLRGMSGPEVLTPNCLTGQGCIFSGVCSPCLKMKEYPKLALGSYVCIGDDNEDGTLFKCGGCGKLRRRRIKEPKAFTGLCLSCGQRAAKGSKTVPKGENKGKIPFNCVGCGAEHFVRPQQQKSPKWKRLCPKCQKPSGAPPPWGWNVVDKDDELPLTKAPVYLSRRKFPRPEGGGPVLVQCVFPVVENENGICGEETEFNFKVLRREWSKATGFCPKHEISGRVSRGDAYAIIQGLLIQPQNANGQKNGSTEKRARGRKAGDTLLDYDEFDSNLKACVIEEWLSVERSITDVKQGAVLTRYHNKYRGDRITESALRARLKKANYHVRWPKFVELTVREHTAT